MANDKRAMFVGLLRKSLGLPNGASSCCAEMAEDAEGAENRLQVERDGCCRDTHEEDRAQHTARAAAN
jgi:hypothetical protein